MIYTKSCNTYQSCFKSQKIQTLATVGVLLVVDNDINDIDDIYETLTTNKQAVYGESITQ
jgi:hypothetical protein